MTCKLKKKIEFMKLYIYNLFLFLYKDMSYLIKRIKSIMKFWVILAFFQEQP